MAATNRWEPDYTWQDGHNPHDHAYILLARVPDDVRDAVWAHLEDAFGGGDDIPGFGGVAFRRADGGIEVASGGEDAMDSLGDGAQALVDQLDAVGYTGVIEWEQLPPVYVP